MILYTNGCSMTYGDELPEQYRLLHNWPAVLSSKLKATLINDSYPGSSNNRIIRTTTEWILNSDDIDFSDLVIIIGWSHINRTEIIYKNKYKQILSTSTNHKPSDSMFKLKAKSFYKYVYDIKTQEIAFSYKLYLFQEFLKSKNIKYFFFNAMHVNEYKNTFLDNIEFKFYLGLFEYCMYDKIGHLPVAKGGHPLKEGHEAWANILYDEMKKVKMI